MSDFTEHLHDLLKNFTKIRDVSKVARDEINKYLKLDKPSALDKKAFENTVLNLTNNLVEEVANVQKCSGLIKVDIDQPKKDDEYSNENINSQHEEEITGDKEQVETNLHLEENKENENEPVENAKPLLKIVDFSKLVDPRNLELMDRNHKRKQSQSNASVIILSSSDEEKSEVSAKNQSLKKPPQISSSNKKLWNKSITSSRIILKKLPDPKDSGKHKSREGLREFSYPKVGSVYGDNVKLIIENEQFKRKPYVKLLRIPCEEMKTFYSVQNESVLAASKSDTKKLPSAAILDEKTGEMINSEIKSNKEKELKRINISKSADISMKNQNELYLKKLKQNIMDKVIKDTERSACPEKSEDSSRDESLKILPKKNQKSTKGKRNQSNSKKKSNSKIDDNTSENEANSAGEEFAAIENNKAKVHDDSTKESDSSNKSNEKTGVSNEEVLKKAHNKSDETEESKVIKELNSFDTNTKQVRNRLPLVLPVPLSDSENDSSHGENSSNELGEKKNDTQVIEPDNVKLLAKNRNNEDGGLSCEGNTSAEEINASTEGNEQFSEGGKPDEENSDQLKDSAHEDMSEGMRKDKKKEQNEIDSTKNRKEGNIEIDNSSEGNKKETDTSLSKKGGSKEKIAVDQKSKNYDKKQNKTLKETRDVGESSDIEDGEMIPRNIRRQDTIKSKKNQITTEKENDSTSSDENISGKKKTREKRVDKKDSESVSHESDEDISKLEQVILKPSLTCQSDEDKLDNESLKNEDSTVVKIRNNTMNTLASSSLSIISDSEKDEPTERKNEDSSNSGSSDKKKNIRRKTSTPRFIISESEEESTQEENEASSRTDSTEVKNRNHPMNTPASSSLSIISDSEKDEPTERINEDSSNSSSSDKKKKIRRKTSTPRFIISDSAEDSTQEKNEASSRTDSPNKEKKLTKKRHNSRSHTSPSDSEKDEPIKKRNEISSDSDSPNIKKKHKKTRRRSSSRSGPSDSEEDLPNKKRNQKSSDSDSPNVEKKDKETIPNSCPSDSEGDAPNKKGNDNSSDSDTQIKRKRSGDNSSDKHINISSEDSEDFSAFYKKNKMLKSSQTKKRLKMKALNSDSEDDGEEKKDENSGSEDENEKTDEDSVKNSSSESEAKKSSTKKRRIIKYEEDSDSSDAVTTRKKIKKLISKNSLSDTTKKAEAEEKERKQRIMEKQKKYNQIYENLDIASSKVDKLILDIDEETDEPLLEVNKSLVSKLKPHQASGIQFMWDACFESLKRAGKSDGSGCIVAHCMGLGKTLQVIALVNTLLEDAEKTKVRKVLVVTPLSTVLNWKAEFANWLSGDEDYDIYELVSCKPQNSERSYYIKQWHKNGGVMIMSYSMFRNLSNEKNKKISKKIRENFTEGLVDPGPDLVICDEGHLLKNEKTGLSIAMNKIKTRRRIVLTGTPLQNNLKEYYCMVQFVKPNLLGTYKEYLNRFVNPITNGQYTDSTDYDINIMRRRSHVLHKLLEGVVQRRDYSVLSPYLPPKFEYILFLTLTDTQKKLYSHYLEHFARKSKDESSNKTSYLFQDFQALSRICIHPRVLQDKSVDDQNKYQSDEESVGSLKNFIDDGSDSTSTPASSESESDKSSESDRKSKKKKRATRRITRAQKSATNSGSESEDEDEVAKEWWQEYCDGDELDNIANSTKFLVLFEILKECEQIGDKVLVFSQSLYALNAIEYFLQKVDEATQNGNADEKTCGYTGSWAPGLDYFRLDGSTNCNLRSNWCDSFNKESNSRARLFLLSTRAGGLGINLVAANRVIIFDVSWNPSSDIQSIYRVYRFGQLKPSYIYRFVMYGTMEMKIYERQVTKQAISKRVIDEQQIDRHYNQHDLGELYKFEQPNDEDRPTPLVPKDVLLADLLQHHEDKIFKYHEHQSLLENKEDETLNEEERKAAWDEFENEKVERTKQTLIGKFSVSTVQLALKSIIQRDNPTWNNSQILSIIPQLIQQLNIQLGAKDMTMYNRIAAEIKLMQEEYTRKMQMHFYQVRMQMEAQKQQQLRMFGSYQPPLPGFGNLQQFPRLALNPAFRPSLPGSSTLNPSEIVELN